MMEITLRTEVAISAIQTVCAEVPEMAVGAGTVVNLEQCRQVCAAGAQFVVSPGLDTDVVDYCLDHGVPVLPGCVTPTEIMSGLKLGLKTFKFFPANVYGGLNAMKALAGPFGEVKFIPTGGVNPDNLESYLKAPYVQAVGGSWLCAASDIETGAWERITSLARQAKELQQKSRG